MDDLLKNYSNVAGKEVVEHLYQLAEPLKGVRVVHVNSTREGGGVAEILGKLVPMMEVLGLDVKWKVIEGNKQFFQCTKGLHNGLQGKTVVLPEPCSSGWSVVWIQPRWNWHPTVHATVGTPWDNSKFTVYLTGPTWSAGQYQSFHWMAILFLAAIPENGLEWPTL